VSWVKLQQLWQRYRKPTPASYPFALTEAQIEALGTLHESEGYKVLQHIVSELAGQRVQALLAADATGVEYERGRLATLREVYDVVDVILTKSKEIDLDRTKRRNGGPRSTEQQLAARHGGNPTVWNRLTA
jgi:hypothetical protein